MIDPATATLTMFGLESDTVGAVTQVFARVEDASGRWSDVRVNFRALWLEDARPERPLSVQGGNPAERLVWQEQVGARTDGTGRATVRVRFETTVGVAGIEASVVDLGLADTVGVTISPGSTTDIVMLPSDTILYLGEGYDFSVTAVDTFGNATGAPVTLGPTRGRVTIDLTAGELVASALGIERVQWRSGTITETFPLAIVPDLSVAVSQSQNWGSRANNQSAILTTDLAGREIRQVFSHDRTLSRHPFDGEHAWSRDGRLLAYTDSGRVYLDDLTGNRVPIAEGQSYGELSWTADGTWVYFTTPDLETWRAATDGSGTELVVDGRGRVSPDGQHLVLQRPSELLLYEIGTGSTSPLRDEDVQAFGWAPDGSTIFVSTGELEILDLAGAIQATVPSAPPPEGVPPSGYVSATFAPEGRFLVAQANLELYLLDLDDLSFFRLPPLHYRAGKDPALSPLPFN